MQCGPEGTGALARGRRYGGMDKVIDRRYEDILAQNFCDRKYLKKLEENVTELQKKCTHIG